MVPSSRCCMRSSRTRALLFFIDFDEAAPGPRQRRPDRSGRQLQCHGDLLVAQSFLAHEQREPVSLGERVDGATCHGCLLRALERGGLLLRWPFRALALSEQREMTPTSSILARFVAHEVRGDREQPRALVVDAILAESAQERLLRNLFRPVAVAKPAREI